MIWILNYDTGIIKGILTAVAGGLSTLIVYQETIGNKLNKALADMRADSDKHQKMFYEQIEELNQVKAKYEEEGKKLKEIRTELEEQQEQINRIRRGYED
jgi:predicted nuclease with TOPRIM domain